jgi:3-oxoacyl-[acyl-carrier protein] reductase
LKQVSGHITNSYGRGLLAGEVAIITGAAQGIGRSAALLFAKEGAKVVVSDLDQAKAEIVVKEIIDAGGDAIAVGGDVSADEFPEKIVKAAVEKYGKINHVVNNAGFTFDKMIHTMSDQAFDIIQAVHVRAPFRIIRAAAPYLRIKGNTENRSIVNVSSTSGLHGNVGQINYAAGKAAVIGMSKTIAKEWGVFGVRANTVAYGLIETRLTANKASGESITIGGQKIALGVPGGKDKPSADKKAAPAAPAPKPAGPHPIPLQRGGSADEAAAAILFLVSPLASYVSGHTLEVTGGLGI